ncbi:MAG: FAD-dependent monooxygenase [Cycloclasticus sp.]|nr:FAD-dependent monooxygenase [Cycloclasticus sp.]MBQ0790855.1 FAD-dependent monooxygenase [Cycloclasticus sp.]
MVGGCLALALGQSPLRVAVVEATSFVDHASNDASKRAIALSWGSRGLLEQLDLWATLSEAAMPIRQIHVSDKGHFGKMRLSAETQQVDALGYVVEASQIEVAVANRLASADVDLLCPAQLLDYHVSEEMAVVNVDVDGVEKALSCRLLVGADGGLSKVRQQGDFELREHAYQQRAITGLLKVESNCCDVAFERFTAEGPIAMLPHFDGLYSLVWTLPSELAERLIQLPKKELTARLQSQFGQWLGALSLVGDCQSFALNLAYVPTTVADRVVLIGNAAHQLHPVAGQGFNLGLRDAAGLAEVLMAADGDVGKPSSLKAYAKRRKPDQGMITGFTDQVVKLFSNDSAALSLIRNSGLLLLDKVPALKNKFARQTMGLATRLARLKAS